MTKVSNEDGFEKWMASLAEGEFEKIYNSLSGTQDERFTQMIGIAVLWNFEQDGKIERVSPPGTKPMDVDYRVPVKN